MYEKMLFESLRLKEQIKQLEEELQHVPPGKISITQDGERFRWIHLNNGKKTYIPKSNLKLAEQLSYKKYLSLLLAESTHEKMAIDLYLKHHIPAKPKSEELITESPEYKRLLAPFFQPLSEELDAWMHESYIKSQNHPEHLIHKTASGNLVRSKSEAMIDMVLYTNHIPFRYECALVLGDVTVFPDFTTRHPKNGKTYYWEHFGLMDNPEYSAKAFSKLQLYNSYEITPSIQLITTYETKEHPLSLTEIERIAAQYFLS